MADKKDTIYIDVDDEITAVIDKLGKSDSKIVALVLPKRMTSLQSIVNMKLLKRSADEAGKQAVLITSEKGLLPLAGATGLYVAKNLNSKPEIPAGPKAKTTEEGELEADLEPDSGTNNGSAANETIDMEDTDVAAASATTKPAKKAKAAKKGAKIPKIPNFEKFRKKTFLVIGAVLTAIFLFILAVVVLPKATILIETNTESMDTSFDFTASPSTKQVDESASVVPAQVATEKVNDSQTVAATGQKDLGSKASGNMTFSVPCSSVSGSPPTIPAGTGVSTSGLTYVTQNNAALTTPNFNGGCTFTGATTVVAQNNGEQYNRGAATYTVSGYSNVAGNGGQMSGGSSKIARVVTAQDVESAKSKLTANDNTIKEKLKKQLEDAGYFVIQSSFRKANETTVPSPGIDQEGSEVKVTYNADYTMIGVKRDDLKKLVQHSLKDDIDTQRQKVQEDGLEQASFTIKSNGENGDTVLTVSTKAEVGPDIDTEALKQDVAGKKSGETENIVKDLPGVKAVEVNYSPFWVSRTPKATKKITVEFKSANQ